MPPQLALVITLVFVAWLFWRDIGEKPNITGAIWLPTIWMFLVASKAPSKWLSILGFPGLMATSTEEGSSFDAATLLVLIALGIWVLAKRRVGLTEFVRDNPWLTLFIFYCFLATFWADLPYVSFKRWIKILGHPVMVLVLFTEPNPMEAFTRTVKRCAYVILPVSILWIKYFLHLGRKTGEWGGSANCGVAAGANALAGTCMLLALFFLWYGLQLLQTDKTRWRRNEIRLVVFLLWMTGYCLVKAGSANADLSLVIGIGTMVFISLRSVNKKQIGAYALAAIIAFVVAQMTFDVYGIIVGLTGHQTTIEGRGRLWQTLLESDTNPLFGVGFEAYWLGERAERIWAMPEFWWHPTQAHNGYLELYLNLGIIGILIFFGVIVAGFRKIRRDLLIDFEWGRFEIASFVAILLHNWTEASFKGLDFSFFFFFILAVNWSRAAMPSGVDVAWETENAELYDSVRMSHA